MAPGKKKGADWQLLEEIPVEGLIIRPGDVISAAETHLVHQTSENDSVCQ